MQSRAEVPEEMSGFDETFSYGAHKVPLNYTFNFESPLEF